MRIPLLLFIALFLSVPAFAGPLEDGKAAISHGDWPTALKLLQPLADRGNAEAQAGMGDIYMSGRALKKDPVEAMKWYHKAADQGNAAGQLNIGIGYKRGIGAAKNNSEALKWIRKAADQGYGPAQLALSGIYAHGDGVKEDDQEAYFRFLLFIKSMPEANAPTPAQMSTLDKFYAEVLAPEQITAAKQRADAWKPAVSGQPPAPPLDLPAKAH